MMAQGTVRVEVAFDAGVTGTPTWTDVTRYVRVSPGIEATHWRDDEDDQCQPSRLSLTLINNDGRFTPGNASSPYYPNVKKRRRIRVVTEMNGEEFPRFTGYVDDWLVDWPETVGHISDCVLTASSRMAVIGSGAELEAELIEESLSHGPIAYYKLDEGSSATAAQDVSANQAASLLPQGVVSFGAGVGPIPDTAAAQFTGAGKLVNETLAATSGDSAISFWVTTSTVSKDVMAFGAGEVVSITAAGKVQFNVAGLTSTTTVTDGEPHHVAASYDGATVSLYVDGALEDTTATFLLLGGVVEVGGIDAPPNYFVGTLSHLAIYNGSLSSADARALALGRSGDTVQERLTQYAAYVGVPSSETDFDEGQTPDLATINPAGRAALDVMRELESTEAGVLFDALDGTLTFRDRTRRYEASAFGTTLFGGAPFGGGPHGTEFTLSVTQGQIASALRPVLDDRQQANDVTAVGSDGTSSRFRSQDSIDDHGLYRDAKTLHTTDPDEPLLRASWTVNRYAEPLTRVSRVEVLLRDLNDNTAALVLGAQVGTIFTIADLPDNAPSDTMHLFVEGRTDRITADEDRITFRTSPAEVYDVFILDDPVRGVIGSDYPLAY